MGGDGTCLPSVAHDRVLVVLCGLLTAVPKTCKSDRVTSLGTALRVGVHRRAVDRSSDQLRVDPFPRSVGELSDNLLVRNAFVVANRLSRTGFLCQVACWRMLRGANGLP